MTSPAEAEKGKTEAQVTELASRVPGGRDDNELLRKQSALLEKTQAQMERIRHQGEKIHHQDEKLKAQGKRVETQSERIRELQEKHQGLKEKFEEQSITLEMLKLTASGRDENAGASAKKIRLKRRNSIILRLLLGVILPTLCGIGYFGFIASDRFESTALFNIQAVDARHSSSMDSLFGVLPGASPTGRDTLTVRDFILSREVLRRLQDDHHFISHFQNRRNDIISRLSQDATLEDAFEYYKDIVRLNYDTTSGVLTLTVTAYSAKAAQEFSQAILDYSEEAVNKLSDRSRQDQTIFAEKELTIAEARLGKARAHVLKLQAERGEFSPQSSATEALSVRQHLEVTLANARTELMGARAYMADSAPQVIVLQQKVNALSAQIKNESRRLVDPTEEGGINTSMAEFEVATFEKEIAQASYHSAIASLELARQEAARQHRYLVRVAKPSLPDESTKPNRYLGVLTVFLGSILLLGIGSLLNAAIREHAKF